MKYLIYIWLVLLAACSGSSSQEPTVSDLEANFKSHPLSGNLDTHFGSRGMVQIEDSELKSCEVALALPKRRLLVSCGIDWYSGELKLVEIGNSATEPVKWLGSLSTRDVDISSLGEKDWKWSTHILSTGDGFLLASSTRLSTEFILKLTNDLKVDQTFADHGILRIPNGNRSFEAIRLLKDGTFFITEKTDYVQRAWRFDSSGRKIMASADEEALTALDPMPNPYDQSKFLSLYTKGEWIGNSSASYWGVSFFFEGYNKDQEKSHAMDYMSHVVGGDTHIDSLDQLVEQFNQGRILHDILLPGGAHFLFSLDIKANNSASLDANYGNSVMTDIKKHEIRGVKLASARVRSYFSYSDGRLLVASLYKSNEADKTRLSICRLDMKGRIDSSFAQNGCLEEDLTAVMNYGDEYSLMNFKVSLHPDYASKKMLAVVSVNRTVKISDHVYAFVMTPKLGVQFYF